MPDITQRLLDAVHPYMPQRMRTWIDARESKDVPESSYFAADLAAKAHYDMLERMEFPAPSKEVNDASLIEAAAFERIGTMERVDDRASSVQENLRAAESWRKDAGETYMAEMANGGGQPNLFNDAVEVIRRAANDVGPVYKPTESDAYKIEHAYHDKHFPTISQEQRDAARASSPTPEHAGQMTLRLGEMQKSNDQGLER